MLCPCLELYLHTIYIFTCLVLSKQRLLQEDNPRIKSSKCRAQRKQQPNLQVLCALCTMKIQLLYFSVSSSDFRHPPICFIAMCRPQNKHTHTFPASAHRTHTHKRYAPVSYSKHQTFSTFFYSRNYIEIFTRNWEREHLKKSENREKGCLPLAHLATCAHCTHLRLFA